MVALHPARRAVPRHLLRLHHRLRGSQNGRWHLTAYCHTRQAIRWFRLDRITAAHLTSHPPTGLSPTSASAQPRNACFTASTAIAPSPGRRSPKSRASSGPSVVLKTGAASGRISLHDAGSLVTVKG
ncbi:MAG: WYL domain-containing protein [Bifidobacteriaceae bacterium]|nr:WYL domain-containing protein [Bifidobacteriaceae bacterium]